MKICFSQVVLTLIIVTSFSETVFSQQGSSMVKSFQVYLQRNEEELRLIEARLIRAATVKPILEKRLAVQKEIVNLYRQSLECAKENNTEKAQSLFSRAMTKRHFSSFVGKWVSAKEHLLRFQTSYKNIPSDGKEVHKKLGSILSKIDQMYANIINAEQEPSPDVMERVRKEVESLRQRLRFIRNTLAVIEERAHLKKRYGTSLEIETKNLFGKRLELQDKIIDMHKACIATLEQKDINTVNQVKDQIQVFKNEAKKLEHQIESRQGEKKYQEELAKSPLYLKALIEEKFKYKRLQDEIWGRILDLPRSDQYDIKLEAELEIYMGMEEAIERIMDAKEAEVAFLKEAKPVKDVPKIEASIKKLSNKAVEYEKMIRETIKVSMEAHRLQAEAEILEEKTYQIEGELYTFINEAEDEALKAKNELR